MKRGPIISLAAASALMLGATTPVKVVFASGMFDIMNPSRWFNNNDDYRYGRYGYGPYGWGGGPYGWGGGPYGWGGGPYGWGGYPGYGPGNTIVVTPQGSGSSEKAPVRLPE